MATDVSPKDCPICEEEYDEKVRCPRIFSCSHTLCTDCIHSLIRDNRKQCPFCRCSFSASRPTDVNINRAALDLINYYKSKESESETKSDAGSSSLLNIVKTMRTEALETNSLQAKMCLETKQRLEKTLEEVEAVEQLLKRENARLTSEVLSGIQRMISENKESLEELKRTKTKLMNQINEIDSSKEKLDAMREDIKECLTDTDMCRVLADVEKVNLSISNAIKKVQGGSSKEDKTLQTEKKKLVKVKEQIRVVLDLLSSSQSVVDSKLGEMAAQKQAERRKDNRLLLKKEAKPQSARSVKYALEKRGVILPPPPVSATCRFPQNICTSTRAKPAKTIPLAVVLTRRRVTKCVRKSQVL